MISSPLDPREHSYGQLTFQVPDDGDFYVIRCVDWMVSRIQVFTKLPAVGSISMTGGDPTGVGAADSDACLELLPNYLLRGTVTVHHNMGTGGTWLVLIEYAYKVNPTGIAPPVTIT